MATSMPVQRPRRISGTVKSEPPFWAAPLKGRGAARSKAKEASGFDSPARLGRTGQYERSPFVAGFIFWKGQWRRKHPRRHSRCQRRRMLEDDSGANGGDPRTPARKPVQHSFTGLRRVRPNRPGVLEAMQKNNRTLRVGCCGEDGTLVVLQYIQP